MTTETTGTTTVVRTTEPGPWRWWLLILGALVTMTLLTWGFAWSVERATLAQARAALDDANLAGVAVADVSYRSVTLTGPADLEDDAVAAVNATALASRVAYNAGTSGDAAAPSAIANPTEDQTLAPSVTATASESASPSESASASPSAEAVEIPALPDLAGVQFESGSATLTSASLPILDQAAEAILDALEVRPQLTVAVEGHTDSAGDEAANLSLSQQRADAVRGYLESRGVPAASITATGYGESRPIADNTTDQGRAANRRVDLIITEG